MTVQRLADAIRARDTASVQRLLGRRPELARMSIDNLHMLHHAVLADAPDIVRLLMAHGANAREGVYPYREATTAHALALQRGHDEIVRVIELAEQEQRDALSRAREAPAADDLFRAIAAGSSDRAIVLMSADPRRIHTRHIPSQLSPLHAAAQALDEALVVWLLDHGADPAVRIHHDLSPLDLAALGGIERKPRRSKPSRVGCSRPERR
jgi:ankyrin repeat protein